MLRQAVRQLWVMGMGLGVGVGMAQLLGVGCETETCGSLSLLLPELPATPVQVVLVLLSSLFSSHNICALNEQF